jgi:hypothetical protein
MSTLSDHRIWKEVLTYPANWGDTFFPFVRMNLIVLFFVIHFMTHLFELFTFQLCFIFLVELPPWFIVRTVVYEHAAVPEVAATGLIPVFAPLRVIVDTSGVSDKGRRSHWAKGAREFLLAEVILGLLEVVLIAVETSVHIRVEFTLLNSFTYLNVFSCLRQCVLIVCCINF